MSSTLIDSKAREEALDCRHSFIVQAPAGSGKTELLTQRILTLLANVSKAPEQVLAITFTKKAAAEMRARVVEALKLAAFENEPTISHQQKSWQLAKRVLERDQKENWNILNQPNRLRILTIDGLCSRIARQSPLLSQCGVNANIADDAIPYYTAAAEALIRSLETKNEWNQALENLLLHLDNHVQWLQSLFVSMLAKRDQWMNYLNHESTLPTLRKQLEEGLVEVIHDSLQHCIDRFPSELVSELIELLNYSADNLYHTTHVDFLPTNKIDDLNSWQTIANLLLTTQGQWRKTVNKSNGFPASSSLESKEDAEFAKEMKDRMINLLQSLENYDSLRESLLEVLYLPPMTYSEQQWMIVSALMTLLPVLLAHLHLEFQSEGVVDYIEVQRAALRALGPDDEPTDVALYWDYRIEHILIDEFQDTSISQFQLIEKLTRGWEINDGRTLFLVGDPMQSIYRFREAQVGLFLRARRQGMGGVPLRFLQLKTNFRSHVKIVDWINEAFEKVFPMQEDIALGAVPYSPSIAGISDINSNDEAINPHLYCNADDDQEAIGVVQLITQKLSENKNTTIAILVRSRNHLENIIPNLQAMRIPFQAKDIEYLAHRMVIRDLLSLTKALWNTGDRLAWLSILRAPWCALNLSDLLILSKDPDVVIWDQLQEVSQITGISEAAKIRITAVVPIFAAALNNIRRVSLRLCIESTWIQLGGPAGIDDQSDLMNAEHFFKLLAKCDRGGDIIYFDELEREVGRLFSSPDPQADGRLQIMSIHKAKGLEFDIVILPGLAKRSANDTPKLLTWLERPRETRSADLILAPIKSAADDHDPIYRYCTRVDAQKAELEMVRLLYVATTRAKRELHLFGTVEIDENGEIIPPSKKTFLNLLWNMLCNTSFVETHPDKVIVVEKSNFCIKNLPVFSSMINQATQLAQWDKLQIKETLSQHIGTLVHEILYRISIDGLDEYPLEKLAILKPFWEIRLRELGVQEDFIQIALQKVTIGVVNTLTDEKGRWILSNHTDAKSEYSISTVNNGKTSHFIIDRTFVHEGIRWIIDYKCSEPQNDKIEEHIMNAKIQYQSQLANYFTAMEVIDNRPIRLCLYFPLIKDHAYVNL